MPVIFRDKEVELSVGDIVILEEPKDDEGFYQSKIGKKFKAEILDTLQVEVLQKEWLEVYFEMVAFKNGERVKSYQFHGDPVEEWGEDHLWDERDAGYHFLRYLLSKGAVKKKVLT